METPVCMLCIKVRAIKFKPTEASTVTYSNSLEVHSPSTGGRQPGTAGASSPGKGLWQTSLAQPWGEQAAHSHPSPSEEQRPQAQPPATSASAITVLRAPVTFLSLHTLLRAISDHVFMTNQDYLKQNYLKQITIKLTGVSGGARVRVCACIKLIGIVGCW